MVAMNLLGFAFALLATQVAPDTAYFQQGVDYRIEARLDDATGVVRGRARLKYTNKSPARLDTLYFHLHLNAFRPNSAWARRELQFNNRRFQDLGPSDYAYERLQSVTVAGRQVTPVFPGGDDSTVVAIPLPSALAPGAATTVLLDWEARPSTLPRRQGRQGRHLDFAQWYPRIAVYDRGGWQVQPLLPQGEFYGEFGTFDVTFDVAADQVIGATGVPVEGDPGWEKASAVPGTKPLYRRDAYPAKTAAPLGFLTGQPGNGRKRVRWRAEDVHHFAWSASPEYIYEAGQHEGTAIHVLYQPGDTTWDRGVAVERTAKALAFMNDLFGPYPYPQVTNVHRIESGGTEFPMLVMDGSASQGLIMHEVGHIWLHGIFGNNEWREGWLDEGFVSFVSNWFAEEQGTPPLQIWGEDVLGMGQLEATGRTEPISKKAADFSSFQMYNIMTYTKPALVLRMLRDLVGVDVTRRALRDYYEHNKFRHVTGRDLRASFERASGQDLGWFFEQWIDTTGRLDYGIGEVKTTQGANGRWQTTVEVIRHGENWMPVTLQVGNVRQRLTSREPRQVIEIETQTRPTEVVLDPDLILIDYNRTNNRKTP